MSEQSPRAAMSVPGDLIDAVKPHADADGTTVGSWIRHAARQEAERRRGAFIVTNPPPDAEALKNEVRRLRFTNVSVGVRLSAG